MTRLLIISASTRPGRAGLPVARWVERIARSRPEFTEVRFVDLAELQLPFLDEPKPPSRGNYVHQHTLDWAATVKPADAVVIVMPEYNYGFSAPLKNALDFLYAEWAYKAVGLVSYGGVSAGTRAAQMLKPVLSALKMYPADAAVTIPFIRQRIDEQGAFIVDDRVSNALDAMFVEVVRLAEALRSLRETD